MIVNVCGFGCSGSSAITDYLKGYKNINICGNFEWQFIHGIDGLCDLKYYLCYKKDRIACNSAIKRFINAQKYVYSDNCNTEKEKRELNNFTNNFINDLNIVSWQGVSSIFDSFEDMKYKKYSLLKMIVRRINKITRFIKKDVIFPFAKKRYFSFIDEYQFNRITSKHLRVLFSSFGYRKEKVNVFDQLLSVNNQKCYSGVEFVDFDKIKSIIVVRDPRDIYVIGKTKEDFSRFMPNNDVNSFICYYKTLIDNIKQSQNTMIVQYEDLIYRYLNTTKRIMGFLGIKNLPENEFVYFDPTISLKYTNLKDKYITYCDDIKLIENKLEKYLYDFSKQTSPFDSKMLMERKIQKKAIYKGL